MKRVLLLAFVALALPAHAIKKPDLSGFRIAGGGTSVSVGPNQSGIAGSLAPVRTGGGATGTIPPGHVGSQIGNSGWYVGTAPAGSSTGTTAHLGHAGDVFFAGTKYPFQAGYKVEPSALINAVGMLCKTPVTCAAALAGSALSSWLSDSGVQVNPDDADYPAKPFAVKNNTDGKQFRISNKSSAEWFPSPSAACSDHATRASVTAGGTVTSVTVVSSFSTGCVFRIQTFDEVTGNLLSDRQGGQSLSSRAVSVEELLPASMDDIAPYMSPRPFSPGVVSELLDKGADIPLPAKPTLSGPTQLKGPVTTTQNADGTTTTKQTVSNFQISGNTITNTSNVTITNTCTAEGSCSTSTETTSPDPNADPDEQSDDSAVDSPMPTIPKLYERQYPDGIVGIWNAKSQQLKETQLASFVSTLMPTGFVAGTCPSWTFDLNIAQWADMGVHVVEPPCWLWGVAKTLVIISALMLARSLIFGG
ncbi:hypothetical protein [Diaphorobacter nitroreducens]|uniref:hypothetical protein n=1 Tax=Diaphorobacter nitroreducens TaxID=164759 RepID=UPI0028A9ABEF|nr:hypothetical protein [Diaphorobacter nitroreducens]